MNFTKSPRPVILRSEARKNLKKNQMANAKVGYRRRIKRKTTVLLYESEHYTGLRPVPHQRLPVFGNWQGNDSLDPDLPAARPPVILRSVSEEESLQISGYAIVANAKRNAKRSFASKSPNIRGRCPHPAGLLSRAKQGGLCPRSPFALQICAHSSRP